MKFDHDRLVETGIWTAMATGDFQNNIRKLQTELRRVRYGKEVDYEG